jgi:hypothetical protein
MRGCTLAVSDAVIRPKGLPAAVLCAWVFAIEPAFVPHAKNSKDIVWVMAPPRARLF